MVRTVLKVEGMSCSHCENAIKNSVCALDGVNAVNVDLLDKTVTVEYENSKVSIDRIKSEIKDLGYDIE